MKLINRSIEILGNYLGSPFLFPGQSIVKVEKNKISAKYHVRPWTADKWIISEVWKMEEYPSKFLFIKPHHIVLDIGAQIGIFSTYASKLASSGKVIAIEPHPQNYSLLLKNIELNSCRNIIPLNLALGPTNCPPTTRLYINPANSGGHSTVSNIGQNTIICKQQSLEDLFSSHKLTQIDYMKMDVEGSEFNILLTTPQKIMKNINQITMEYHDYLVAPRHHQEIVDFLKANGYKVKVVKYPVISQIMGLGHIHATRI